MERRFVILSASMGAGHEAVAAELSRRLTARGHRVETIDILSLLPLGLGPGLRRFYAVVIRRAPWVYGVIYRLFFVPRGRIRGGTGPVVAPMAAALRRRLEPGPPDAVVPVFHLAAQVCGRLRARGALRAPSAVLVTDFAVHRQWVHPGNDVHLCPTTRAADAVRRMGGRGVHVVGPVVNPAFVSPADPDRDAAGADPDAGPAPGQDPPRRLHPAPDTARPAPGPQRGAPVLVSGGAWAAGSRLERTAALLAAAGYVPVVLCGRDQGLRRRLARVPGTVSLGWTDDMAVVLSGVRALVDNAAGQTAVQAMAAGVPVVAHRPIPGHGADGARRMAQAGAATLADDERGLLAALDRLTADGPARAAVVAAGRRLFVADAAVALVDTVRRSAPHTQPNCRASTR